MTSSPPESFHRFGHLPYELRLQIWQHSFLPRTIEVHTRRPHYADGFRHGQMLKWQSRCTNPSALSVNAEARAAAQKHYTIKIPLVADVPWERAGDGLANLDRILYFDPSDDTLVVLGDMDFRRMSLLVSDLRERDPAGDGLKHLAISATWTIYHGASQALRFFVRDLCPKLVDLTVFMYTERVPPENWTSGVCSLDDCSETNYYKKYAALDGRGMQDGDDWAVIGTSQVKIRDLNFRSMFWAG